MKAVFTINRLFLAVLAALLINGSAFAFAELDGTRTTIEDNVGKGKWTVAEIWSYTCHNCHEHMPSMVKFDGKMENTRLIGIAIDGSDKTGVKRAKSMIEKHDISFKSITSNPIEMNDWILSNLNEPGTPAEEVRRLRGTPTFMIFNPEGEVVAFQPGLVSTVDMEKFIKSRM